MPLVAGDGHACAIERDGIAVRCFGRDDHGQAAGDAPALLPPSLPPPAATHTCAGAQHSCVARQAPAGSGGGGGAAVRCWGADGWGQSSPPPALAVAGGGEGGRIVALECGAFHTCALVSFTDGGGGGGGGDGGGGGKPVCWGRGPAAQVPGEWAAEPFRSITTG
jgi:hypothetical protein